MIFFNYISYAANSNWWNVLPGNTSYTRCDYGTWPEDVWDYIRTYGLMSQNDYPYTGVNKTVSKK